MVPQRKKKLFFNKNEIYFVAVTGLNCIRAEEPEDRPGDPAIG